MIALIGGDNDDLLDDNDDDYDNNLCNCVFSYSTLHISATKTNLSRQQG